MAMATERKSSERQTARVFTSDQRQSLRRRLLAWYRNHARDLPWRRSRDPYRVWISEVMLQQTQVATVRDYFERFVAALPDVHQLAAADEQQVLRLWEGMGYYRRARQLHAAAKEIVSRRGGEFPSDVCELVTLPGIGRYTAGAIASIAFGRRVPILEANTTRLFSRLICYRGDPSTAAAQRLLWRAAEEILPHKDVAEFNQALMELGSLICTPAEPNCPECPLSGLCEARASGLQNEIPPPKARKEYSELREAAVVVRHRGRVLLRQCGTDERWAGLWDFPRFALQAQGPLFAADEIAEKVYRQTGIRCIPGPLVKRLRHGVTRFRITLDCYDAKYAGGRARSASDAPVRWLKCDELPTLPLSTTGRKLAELVSR
ncbi:MAG TPA: A/G-specific adenine glycosylase [Lacipirellulaceae bacterium]|jgi:A/G-specific adenine glycosylase|nr:A/G-specific adenine glycosylase [Lacipirellulaceae bacterium]